MRARWLGLLVVGGCAPLGRDELQGIEVESAELDDVEVGAFGAVVGFAEGTGDLVVVDTSGRTSVFPVTLGGGMVGVVIDMGGSIDKTNRTALILPDEPITGDQLLGVYSGTGEDAMLGLGVQAWNLRNKAGVELGHGWVSAGFGVMVDLSWLRMRIGHGEVGAPGTPATDTAPPAATADTADTAREDTGPRAGPDTDNGSAQVGSSGCGGGRSSSGGDGCGDGCGGGCCGDSCSTTGAALVLVPLLRSRRRGRSAA